MDKSNKIYLIIFILLILILILFIPLTILLNNIGSSSNDSDVNNIINNNPKNLISIIILRVPNKIQYREGELFDKSGMLIKGIYDDYSQIYINNYLIDKNLPLTIYDTNVIISYKGKTTSLKIHIVNKDAIEINQNPSKEKYTIKIEKEDITRFEMEDSNISNWIISNNNNQNKIIERKDSSRGSFLSGIDEDTSKEGKLVFNLDLKFNSAIKMYVSYSKNEKWKNYDIDISSIYTFIINDIEIIEIQGNTILKKSEDIKKWQIIEYKLYSLPKGIHTLSIIASSNNEIGSPNIDYIDFKIIKINEMPIEPDEEMPSNDFHTLLQYQYINDDMKNIHNYATGAGDLSRPKGNILNFSDSVKSSSSYVLQISSSPNFDTLDTKIIRDLKIKKYIIKNLKLNQTIFYRAAISEGDLKNSKIYELTTNTLPPRNLDIPGVDNSRDIGGYKTTLIENGIIKQGLFHRTAKTEEINEKGKKVVNDLGIKVEIDLRDEIYTNGPYIDGVKYYNITIYSGAETTWFDSFEEQFVKIFNLISEADKNPIILHCTHGADRTGIISFALLTLLGCEYEDIARDFCFTNFGQQGIRNINSSFQVWWNKLTKFEGETMAEKSKFYLIGKGIEESKLEHIRAIFIDGYKEKVSINNDEEDHLKDVANMIDNSFFNFLGINFI